MNAGLLNGDPVFAMGYVVEEDLRSDKIKDQLIESQKTVIAYQRRSIDEMEVELAQARLMIEANNAEIAQIKNTNAQLRVEKRVKTDSKVLLFFIAIALILAILITNAWSNVQT